MEPLPSSVELLVVGELLADLIADEDGRSITSVALFRRTLGGSATNVAVGFALLGGRVALVGAAGRGPTGTFLVDELRRHGVDPGYIRRTAEPSTVVFVDRGRATPEFEVLRGADRMIRPTDVPPRGAHLPVLHTSAFALSRDPARGSIMAALEAAAAAGSLVSLDLNYERSVWGGQRGAATLARAVALAGLVKASRDDLGRLFGRRIDPERGATILLEWGARAVVLTMGGQGAWYRSADEEGRVQAAPAAVVDTTGAGDAFWAGVLRGVTLGVGLGRSVELGSRIAARKVERLGPLPRDIDVAAELASIDDAASP